MRKRLSEPVTFLFGLSFVACIVSAGVSFIVSKAGAEVINQPVQHIKEVIDLSKDQWQCARSSVDIKTGTVSCMEYRRIERG